MTVFTWHIYGEIYFIHKPIKNILLLINYLIWFTSTFILLLCLRIKKNSPTIHIQYENHLSHGEGKYSEETWKTCESYLLLSSVEDYDLILTIFNAWQPFAQQWDSKKGWIKLQIAGNNKRRDTSPPIREGPPAGAAARARAGAEPRVQQVPRHHTAAHWPGDQRLRQLVEDAGMCYVMC